MISSAECHRLRTGCEILESNDDQIHADSFMIQLQHPLGNGLESTQNIQIRKSSEDLDLLMPPMIRTFGDLS